MLFCYKTQASATQNQSASFFSCDSHFYSPYEKVEPCYLIFLPICPCINDVWTIQSTKVCNDGEKLKSIYVSSTTTLARKHIKNEKAKNSVFIDIMSSVNFFWYSSVGLKFQLNKSTRHALIWIRGSNQKQKKKRMLVKAQGSHIEIATATKSYYCVFESHEYHWGINGTS